MTHITNRLDLFEPSSFYKEEHEFEAANGKALYCTKKGMIVIHTSPGSSVWIQDVCYVPLASANLILMGILKRCGWSYTDEDDHMLLARATATIRAKLTKQNIYRLVMYSGKEVLMAVQGHRGRPTHLKGVTPMQRLWRRRFGHASHTRVKLCQAIVSLTRKRRWSYCCMVVRCTVVRSYIILPVRGWVYNGFSRTLVEQGVVASVTMITIDE